MSVHTGIGHALSVDRKRRPSRGFKSSVNSECDGECWAATRVGANSDSDTDYHPKSLSIPTSSQPGRARAPGHSTQGRTVAAETGWADTPLVRASALHDVSHTWGREATWAHPLVREELS